MDTAAIIRADRARRLARIRAEDAVLEHAIQLRTSVECEGRNHALPNFARIVRASDWTKYPRGYRNGGRTVGTADGVTRSVKRIYADGTSEIVPTSSVTRKGTRTRQATQDNGPTKVTRYIAPKNEAALRTTSFDASHAETY